MKFHIINLMLFKTPQDNSSLLFDCFPGGQQALLKMVAQKTKQALPKNILAALDFIGKNKILNQEQLLDWRSELIKITATKNNKIISYAIGVLTLFSGDIRHLACIPDGNRRWAQKHKLPVARAHEQAFLTSIPSLVEKIFSYEVHTFSVFFFQPNNLQRSKEEVIESILKNLIKMLPTYVDMAKRLNIRIYHIGNKNCSVLDSDIQFYFRQLIEALDSAEQETQHFSQHHFIIGANYEREDDLLRAIQKINSKQINPNELKPNDIIQFTDMNQQPYPCPDLCIRTAMPKGGGRLGGFLPKTSDSCIYFTPILAPELLIKDVIEGATIFANPLFKHKSAEQSNNVSLTLKAKL